MQANESACAAELVVLPDLVVIPVARELDVTYFGSWTFGLAFLVTLMLGSAQICLPTRWRSLPLALLCASPGALWWAALLAAKWGCPPAHSTEVLSIGVLSIVGLLMSRATIRTYYRKVSEAVRLMSLIEGNLTDVLADGTVRLLSAHWLRAQPDSFVLSRRQELPVAAFVSPEEASDLLAAEKVGALSYCWADRAVHDGGVGPDPNGFHTRTIRAFLKSSYGRRRVVALMIDYASLYQSDPRGHRTEEENASFKAGLSAMQHIYSSPRVLVLQHKALPCTATRKRYDESGWPMFEQSIATLATEGGGHIFSLDTNARVRVQAGLRRSADEMERFFHSERTHFYGRADRDTVSGMYRALLENVEAYEMATMPKLVSCVDGALTGMDSSGRIADVETSAVGTRDESSGVFLRCSLLVGLPTACVIFCISAFMQPGIDSFVMAAFLFFFTVATILSSRVLRNHLVHVLSGMPKEQRPYALHFSVHRPPLRRQARIPLLRPLHTDA